MINRKRIASVNYTRPPLEIEQVPDPLTEAEINWLKTRIKAWLDSHDTQVFSMTDVVQRVKMYQRKQYPNRHVSPSQIRAVITTLIIDEEIQEIKEGN